MSRLVIWFFPPFMQKANDELYESVDTKFTNSTIVIILDLHAVIMLTNVSTYYPRVKIQTLIDNARC